MPSLAVDTVRDVTARYASDWSTGAQRQRVGRGWWEETLRPFQPDDLLETMQENEAIMCTYVRMYVGGDCGIVCYYQLN